MNLEHKVAVVTGGSKGIGKAIALSLADHGVDVAIAARGRDALDATKREIEARGRRAYAFQGDMSLETDIQNFIRGTIENMGRMDILVNNAGVGHFANVAELTTQDWDTMFDLNVRGLFIATRESLPHLRQAGESVIINIASLAGKNSFIGGSGYSATKHAVIGFSRCLMLEERNNGVRVLVICPGSVATDFGAGPSAKKERALRSEDVADSILHMLKLPQRAMVSEIDIRPTNP